MALGCVINAVSLYMMSHMTLTVDYWSLVWPRFIQGLGLGFIFVPLVTLTLATIDRQKLGNATAAFNVLRNLGGSVGVALATTFLTRRSQAHQSVLAAHVNVWDPATAARLKAWTAHFASRGSDSFTAEKQATAMLYHDVVGQAQVLAYADDFWMLAVLFTVVPLAHPAHAPRPRPARCRLRRADGTGGALALGGGVNRTGPIYFARFTQPSPRGRAAQLELHVLGRLARNLAQYQ